jgi:hypothetical protein
VVLQFLLARLLSATSSARLNYGGVGDRIREPLSRVTLSREANDQI